MTFPIRPIGPKDAKKAIPEFVIEAVNELINEKYDCQGGSFTLRQGLVKDRIRSKTEQDFDYAWLDFKPLYESAGWHVYYDKPGYCEDYEAYFKFSPKK